MGKLARAGRDLGCRTQIDVELPALADDPTHQLFEGFAALLELRLIRVVTYHPPPPPAFFSLFMLQKWCMQHQGTHLVSPPWMTLLHLRPRFHEAAFGSATLGLPTYANPLTLSTLSPDSLSGFVEDHFTGGAGHTGRGVFALMPLIPLAPA